MAKKEVKTDIRHMGVIEEEIAKAKTNWQNVKTSRETAETELEGLIQAEKEAHAKIILLMSEMNDRFRTIQRG
jgi:hypothetical protein